ncbi:MAG: hypothetical protein JO041_05655 [Acidobacteria bacterium]|nr:hypothetical protein [Acidobacteriota bacterium]
MRTIASLALYFVAAATLAPAQDSATPKPPEARRQMVQRGTAGTITAISGNTITIKQAMNGATATVKLSEKTEYRKEREPAKVSDFKVGDFIIVRGEPTGSGEIAADMVLSAPPGGRFMMRGPGGESGGMMLDANMADMGKTFIIGEVKVIDGLSITVHRPDNQDQTIQVDENTSFRKAGESITLPDVKVGDSIMARGALKDGVFRPATLNVLDPAMIQMRRRGPQPSTPPQ